MLKKDRCSMESYIHHCDGRSMRYNDMEIRVHDVKTMAIDKRTQNIIDSITYCPYCGIKVEEDIREVL